MLNNIVPRRSFLAKFAVSSAVLGSSITLPAFASAASASASDELEAWFAAMKGPNKVIYDCAPASAAPDGVLFARNLIKFSAEQLGTKDADNSVVICFRHFATPFGYTDAMWAKYPQLAVMLKVDDPGTTKPAVRNWLLHELVVGESGANIPGVTAHGVKFAICGAATSFISRLLADKTGDPKKIEAELAANLIPSARMTPAGVVAVQRAQKAGFAYTYAG